MSLTVGDRAPDFCLASATGDQVCLGDFRGQWLILYFYPRDNTPGCTKEACGYRDVYEARQDQNLAIVGISGDSAQSHQKFIQKYRLPFPLLCDLDGTVARAYDSYGPKKFMGKEYEGIYRNTFLIDPQGNLAGIYLKVKPDAHIDQVMADFQAQAS
ncbi:thioredoxin-dependent thiol peroxidase [Candidatus Synechococcus calcipolaris G9]|uniref:thioredoxin-dependent peroxiredoxin n=1 Tax=Candidatus Synechococcus calcipolaris G9 TaxID=1497997 RepID=A0ABT6F2T2_9SYNE|nr:thioredoxin-dependent thiol peroxidase [Candidatus Synechococcus calcipolaris]MDG2992172.1 thioredoxin-dependent thiol peroxidase [Candidatus Synechococcus calcipolaris G9]